MKYEYNGIKIKRKRIEGWGCIGCIFEHDKKCDMEDIEYLKSLECYEKDSETGEIKQTIWIYDES